eukprot:213311_1
MSASKTFNDMQLRWMQRLMKNTKLCDAQFRIGEEKKEMYGIRSLLANISPVFKAQLYGSFSEAHPSTIIEYPTISPQVFECIIRSSFCLDPNITVNTVIPLMKACQMLQIPEIIQECSHFLANNIDKTNALEILISAYKTNALSQVLYHQCLGLLCSDPAHAVSQDAFRGRSFNWCNHVVVFVMSELEKKFKNLE